MIKLTDSNMLTHGGTQWTLGETRRVSGEFKFCSPSSLHGYVSVELAAFLDPIHGKYGDTARAFSIREFLPHTDGLKRGGQEVTLEAEISLPRPTLQQRVIFGILVAFNWSLPPAWLDWACGVLSGRIPWNEDEAAERAAARAAAAERAAAATAWAARAAARAAEAAEAAERAAGINWNPAEFEAHVDSLANLALQWE